MKEEEYVQIQEIIGKIECPKNFLCADKGFEDLCKVMYFGARDYLVCLENDPQQCIFCKSGVCTCPIRVYIAKHLKR